MTASNLTAVPELLPAGPNHAVQFYESDDFLRDSAVDFIGNGVVAGEPVVVIATDAHRQALASALQLRGLDVDASSDNGDLVMIDAGETLATFMVGDLPDTDRFRISMGSLIEKVARGRRRIRSYGEMVDLLWRAGKPDGAIRIEELWNDLARHYTFSLLCACGMRNFYSESHAAHFENVCSTHSHVFPAEMIPVGDDPQMLARAIARLQQQARALTSEIEHRKELEGNVRRTSENNEFLLKATTALNRSLEYDERLLEIAQLAVPYLADWCAVDIRGDNGVSQRMSVTGDVPEGVNQWPVQMSEAMLAGEPQLIIDSPTVLIVPMRAANGLLGAITFADLSGRGYAEADAALASEFASRAVMALENARLHRMAQDGNRIKDQFLATLSHELRTPLTAILGWSRMLTLGGLDRETMQTAYGTIERAARNQAALIDDLLDLSRVVTGKLSLRNEPVDLSAIIEGALETLGLAARSKGIRLHTAAHADRAIVTGDATRLKQIAWNLLSNAIKFSNAGGSVFVDVERRNGSAKIIVRDEGRGISAGFLPHVFDPFRQADGKITREHGGLGLGLAIVKYLAELHGGSVTARSAGEGQGATLAVTLPLAVQSTAKLEIATPPPEVADLTGAAVLIVDDDEDTRNLIATILRRAGATVVTAESVPRASSALDLMTPDVIVSDLAMPEQDGFAFLRKLQCDERRRNIPVVALTAATEEHAKQRIDAAGFHAHVQKPIDPLQFVRTVADLRAARGG